MSKYFFELKDLFDQKVSYKEDALTTIPNICGQTKAIFFDALQYKGKNTTCFAYLGTPDTEMPTEGYPAVVLVHGARGCAVHEWVEYWNGKGYVAIAIDLYGQQYGCVAIADQAAGKPNPQGRPHKGENGDWIFDDTGSMTYTQIDYRDSWTYYNVANVILAHNILRQSAFVNNDKIGLTGISYGGVLTCIACGIDDRFSAFAPVFSTGYLRQCHVGLDKPLNCSLSEWESLFDPKSYIAFNTKPMLFTMGMDDHSFSPAYAQPTYNTSQGKMYYSYRKSLRHYLRFKDEENMIHISRFMDMVLKGKSMPFQVVFEQVKDNCLNLRLDSKEKVKSIRLIYTDAIGEDWSQWDWKSEELAVGCVVSVAIPENAKYYFIEMSDREDFEFSMSSSLRVKGWL